MADGGKEFRGYIRPSLRQARQNVLRKALEEKGVRTFRIAMTRNRLCCALWVMLDEKWKGDVDSAMAELSSAVKRVDYLIKES